MEEDDKSFEKFTNEWAEEFRKRYKKRIISRPEEERKFPRKFGPAGYLERRGIKIMNFLNNLFSPIQTSKTPSARKKRQIEEEEEFNKAWKEKSG